MKRKIQRSKPTPRAWVKERRLLRLRSNVALRKLAMQLAIRQYRIAEQTLAAHQKFYGGKK